MRVLVACNAFKGTLTSLKAGEIIKDELLKKDKNDNIDVISLSDGGDGFLETIADITKSEIYECCSFDALYRKKTAHYLFIDGTVYIELADVVGIKDLAKNELSPFTANTFGLGYLIDQVITKHVVKKIILGIGGSASTDGGCGMLEALGARFMYNDVPISLINNYKLGIVTKIDLEPVFNKLGNIEIVVLTDVYNPLCGKNGAAYVFGPQKGASGEDLPLLDANLNHLVQVTQKHQKALIPGSGAAGGVGYGALVGFNAKIYSGIDYLLELINFNKMSQNYDLIITGEGKFDEQSKNGKVYQGLCKNTKTKVIVVCGIDETKENNVYAIVPNITTAVESNRHAEKYLRRLIETIKIKSICSQ